VKYAVIQAHREEFPIVLMCRALGVSRAGFYAAQKREVRQREEADQRLLVEIRSIHRRSKRRYGSPRVHAELKANGVHCGRKRIERLMREDGLRAKKKRRWRAMPCRWRRGGAGRERACCTTRIVACSTPRASTRRSCARTAFGAA
jgi:transposase InsO family protein